MCGRYSIGLGIEDIAQQLGAALPEAFDPNYNAAPSQQLPVISNRNPRQMQRFSWGFLPQWAARQDNPKRLINARAETVHEKASFKQAFQQRRCLLPADGYYEWKKTTQGKEPYRIMLRNEQPFVFAGLWNAAEDEPGNFCIITTQAAEAVAHIHDRMPVILEKEAWNFWLSDTEDTEGLQDVLRPLDSEQLQAYHISKRVNSVQNNDLELIRAVE